MTYYQYTKAMTWMKQKTLPHSLQGDGTTAMSLPTCFSQICTALLEALTEAAPILWKDGIYKKPTLFNGRMIQIGKIGIKLIITIVKTLKNC